MIAFADRSMVPALKELWKLSFGDPEGYIDLFLNTASGIRNAWWM